MPTPEQTGQEADIEGERSGVILLSADDYSTQVWTSKDWSWQGPEP